MLKTRDLDSMTRMLARSDMMMQAAALSDSDSVDDQFVRTMIAQTAIVIATLEAYCNVGTDDAVLAWAVEELDDTREDAAELDALLADLEEDDADPNDPNEGTDPYMG